MSIEYFPPLVTQYTLKHLKHWLQYVLMFRFILNFVNRLQYVKTAGMVLQNKLSGAIKHIKLKGGHLDRWRRQSATETFQTKKKLHYVTGVLWRRLEEDGGVQGEAGHASSGRLRFV